MLEIIVALVLAFILSFLLGSIPFGLIISKLFFKTDIREHGSGNIGTTNAMRTMGKVGGAAVFLLDFSKGLASGILGVAVGQGIVSLGGNNMVSNNLFSLINPSGLHSFVLTDDMSILFVQSLLALSFLGCVWGHIFSPWLKFKGGKGIAVAIGCLFVTFGFAGAALELAIFIVIVLTTRYVSLGSIAAALLCPFLGIYYFAGNWLALVSCLLVGVTVIWAHRENIKRLRAGTENRIKAKKAL